ncbi:MAG: hypothetical protein M3Y87_17005, partial [Myxococcota bacterium]|nr:hypothetical protein [Myxococcota bacterium]
YTVARPLRETRALRLDVPDLAAVRSAFLAYPLVRPGGVSRAAAVAECLRDLPGDAPLTVPIAVSGWNGQVTIRWDDLPARPTEMSRSDAARWYCIQDVLTYGRVPHGAQDHRFEIEVLRGGTLRAR